MLWAILDKGKLESLCKKCWHLLYRSNACHMVQVVLMGQVSIVYVRG